MWTTKCREHGTPRTAKRAQQQPPQQNHFISFILIPKRIFIVKFPRVRISIRYLENRLENTAVVLAKRLLKNMFIFHSSHFIH